MKNVLFVFIILLLTSCNSQKKFTDFDISYSRSGGKIPQYENFLIKGNKGFYSLDNGGKKISKSIVLTSEEIDQFYNILKTNNFLRIEEDNKKVYDAVSTRIRITKGENEGSKTDASLIKPKSAAAWNNITSYFQNFISAKFGK